MQVATAPYSASLPHPHYHPYYQLPPPGPQDHDLKRQYLALLPPQQIIEICLTFDVHVPPYIKSTIWPLDFHAAITHLQSTKNAAEKPPEQEKPKEDGHPMDSLESPRQNDSSSSEQQIEKETEPRPPDKSSEDAGKEATGSSESTSATSLATAGSSLTSTENAQSLNTSSTATTIPPPEPSTSSTSPPHPTPTPVPAAQPPQPATPYPYAYPPQYPQPQYYAGGYAYPYAAYPPPPPPMQAGYAPVPQPAVPQIHQPYPTVTTSSMYNNVMPIVAPGQDGQVNPDDLPSYEEMIVEALTDCPDAEGWAPKDLFTWMAKRYPLQSNFRPSASQALQKAFKRGRFEKSSQGKYRLSASWEGGNTSRRTTRRPQTHPSIASQPTATPSGPPFTHAPLVHHASAAQQPQPGYPAQPYGYQFQQQPIAYTQPAAAAPVAASATNNSAVAKPAETTESADAYEAAKTILNAINFGDLLKLPADDAANPADNRPQDDVEHQLIASGVENLLSHVQAALASSQANQTPIASDALSIPGASMSVAVAHPQPQSQEEQTGGPRAELQAQLALLAAQLAELSQSENAPPAPEIAIPSVISPLPPPIIPVSAPIASTIPHIQPQPEVPPPMASLIPPPPSHVTSSPAPTTEPEPVPIPTAVQEPEPEPEPVPPSASEEHRDMGEPPLAYLQPQLQLEDMEDSDEDDDDMEEVI